MEQLTTPVGEAGVVSLTRAMITPHAPARRLVGFSYPALTGT